MGRTLFGSVNGEGDTEHGLDVGSLELLSPSDEHLDVLPPHSQLCSRVVDGGCSHWASVSDDGGSSGLGTANGTRSFGGSGSWLGAGGGRGTCDGVAEVEVIAVDCCDVFVVARVLVDRFDEIGVAPRWR